MTVIEKESSPRQVAASGTMKHQQVLSSDKELCQPQEQQPTIETMEEGSGLLHRDDNDEASTTNTQYQCQQGFC